MKAPMSERIEMPVQVVKAAAATVETWTIYFTLGALTADVAPAYTVTRVAGSESEIERLGGGAVRGPEAAWVLELVQHYERRQFVNKVRAHKARQEGR